MSDANENGAVAPEEAAALKADRRKKLKRLQLIVHGRADEEVPAVLDEVRAALAEFDYATNGERAETNGHDRRERKGRDRSR